MTSTATISAVSAAAERENARRLAHRRALRAMGPATAEQAAAAVAAFLASRAPTVCPTRYLVPITGV